MGVWIKVLVRRVWIMVLVLKVRSKVLILGVRFKVWIRFRFKASFKFILKGFGLWF